MNDNPPPLQPYGYAPMPPQKKSGCGWGLGCGLGCLITVIVAIVLLVVAGVAFKKWAVGAIDQYTGVSPVPIEAPQVTRDQIDLAVAKFNDFMSEVKKGETTEDLILTGDELNAVLWNAPEFSAVAGKVTTEIEGDVLKGMISMKADDIPFPKDVAGLLSGKYINGEVAVKADMEDGAPAVYLDGLTLNGFPVPQILLSEFEKVNIFDEMRKKPEGRAMLERLGDLRIKDGKLTVQIKPEAEK